MTEDLWYIHDNKTRPDLPDGARVFVRYADGTTGWSEVEAFDWAHDLDPIVAYRVCHMPEA